MSVWVEYNLNPVARRVGDCAVRAVAKALDVDWETAYVMISLNGFSMGDMPSSDAVWGAVLRQHSFVKKTLPESCPECYTAEDFCIEHPEGLYVLGFGGHTATVEDGHLYDSWDSSGETVVYFWEKRNSNTDKQQESEE